VSTSVYDVVLFDLDGTLTDSALGMVNCLRFALDDMGIPVPPDATIRTFLGPPLVDTFRDHFDMTDDQVDYAIAKYRERYHLVGLFENDVYPGIPELLDALGRTDAVLAVATSKPTYSATRILEHFGLAGHFVFIGGADLEGVRHNKASVIEHTLEELTDRRLYSPASSIVMIGDREHDVRGARAHGIDCIGVLWGYGSAGELLDAGAAPLVETPADLLAVLTR
jgi:phosphoglycolate phosphatase